MLMRPLKMTEWEIFRTRASRVKHLRLIDPSRPVDISTIHTLCHPPTTSPLFPNLRSIFWNDDRPETFSFIRMLSGPTVTSIIIDTPENLNTWQTTELGIMTSLPYICPNVTHVSLPSHAYADGISCFSEALCAWGKLTEISCKGIDATALVHLAGQPTLRKLSFVLPYSRAWLDSLPSGSFFSVRDFEIHTANLSFLVEFINKLEGSPTSLRMQVETNPPLGVVNSFLTTLGRFSTAQLQDLSLRLMTRSRPGPPIAQYAAPPLPPALPPHPYYPHHYHPYYSHPLHSIPPPAVNGSSSLAGGSQYAPSSTPALTLCDFAPLTFFENLGRIDINVDHAIYLNDDDLESLASSWPHLHYLSLNDVSGWRVKSGITHFGLLAMLECCPSLQTLCIALNTDSFKEVPADRPGEGIENTSLRILGLADSTIESSETVAVAAFLSDIFPNLTDIAAWGSVELRQRSNSSAVYGERWTHVCEMVKGINQVRQQERRWQQLDSDEGEGES